MPNPVPLPDQEFAIDPPLSINRRVVHRSPEAVHPSEQRTYPIGVRQPPKRPSSRLRGRFRSLSRCHAEIPENGSDQGSRAVNRGFISEFRSPVVLQISRYSPGEIMQMPKVHGVIRRRLLVNFRVEPALMQRNLPAPFRPKLHDGHAVAGICLIRLEEIRPKRFPRVVGLSSENAAHRVAVVWEDADGPHEGVYIPRRERGHCSRIWRAAESSRASISAPHSAFRTPARQSS